jgi:hypothetical protein
MRFSFVKLAMLAIPAALVLSGCPRVPELGGVPETLRFGIDETTSSYVTTQTFTVFNDGSDETTLVFAIEAPSQGWISVTPAEGMSTSEEDPVVVTVTIDRNFALAKNSPEFASGTVKVTSNGGERTIVVTTAPDYFTESFANDFDINDSTFTYTPNGSLSFYGALQTDNGGIYPTDPTGGLILDFDAFGNPVETQPLGGKKVSFYGNEYSRIFISSEGHVGFGAPGGSPNSAGEHFANPQISLFPVNALLGGEVSILQDADKFIVTYDNVPTANSVPPVPNDVQLELFFDGKIRISYLETDPEATGVVGLSSGFGADGAPPSDFVETDISDTNTNVVKVAL